MLDKEFITIDSHCHAGESWYEPIEALRFHLDESQINKAVLIGHMGAYQNNDYLLECKNNFPDRFAVVGVFNLDMKNKTGDLYIKKGKIVDNFNLKPTGYKASL